MVSVFLLLIMLVPENVYAIQETVTELVEEKEAEVMEAQAYKEEEKNSENEIILGDANGDEQINISDLLVVLRHISATTNNKHPDWILKDNKLKAADINKDGKVNSIDMLVILRYISAKSNPEIAKKHSDWLIIDKTNEEEEKKEIEVSSVKLNKTEITIEKNKTEKLTATVEPENAVKKEIEWTTSNEKIATVENGTITGVGEGTAVITAKTSNGTEAICKVTVKEEEKEPEPTPEPDKEPTTEKAVTKVSINSTEVTLDLSSNPTKTLTAKVEPNDATDKTVTWTSNNTKVAEVNSKTGEIKGKKNGTAEITARTSNGITATSKVKVTTKMQKIDLTANQTVIDMSTTKTIRVNKKVTPVTSENQNVTWVSSNTKVATVDKNGIITAVGNGPATITAIAQDGSKAEGKITIQVKTTPTKISLNKSKSTIEAGKKLTLKATTTPAISKLSTDSNQITWSSNNTKVATVNKNGVVTGGKKEGKATITAKTANGKIAVCKVTVAATTVKLDRTILMIDNTHYNIADLEAKLSSTALYKGSNVTWTIDNTNVVKFKKGSKKYKTVKGATAQIVGLKYGEATITATLPNKKTATCKLKVITSSAEKSNGDRYINFQHGGNYFPFYLRKGDWGKKYVEAYVNNAEKIVKKYPKTFAENQKRDVWCYKQKSLKFNVDAKAKTIKSYTGNHYGNINPSTISDFQEIHMIKKKGELSPNDYILLFTSKNQWAYVLHKNAKTGNWERVARRESAAGYYRDQFEGYLCTLKLGDYVGMTYMNYNRGASSAQNAVHKDFYGAPKGQPASHGCIRLAYENEEIFYKVFVEAGVGTRLILF